MAARDARVLAPDDSLDAPSRSLATTNHRYVRRDERVVYRDASLESASQSPNARTGDACTRTPSVACGTNEASSRSRQVRCGTNQVVAGARDSSGGPDERACVHRHWRVGRATSNLEPATRQAGRTPRRPSRTILSHVRTGFPTGRATTRAVTSARCAGRGTSSIVRAIPTEKSPHVSSDAAPRP